MRDQDGPVVTATFATIAAYLQANGLLREALAVEMDGQLSPLLPPQAI